MATVNSDFVLNKILSGYTFFQICEPDGKTVISEQNQNLTPETAAAIYQEAVNNIDGALIVSLQTNSFTPGKGGLKRKGETLTIRTTGGKSKTIAAPMLPGNDLSLILDLHSKQTAALIEIERLKYELQKKDEDNNPMWLPLANRAINSIELFLTKPKNIPKPKPVKPNLSNPGKEAIISEATQNKLSSLFADPETALDKIATILQENPDNLNQLKTYYGLE
jgi:hypothetical protein